MSGRAIDINVDIGEYADAAAQRKEWALLPWASSVNIACGGHAGERHSMHDTLRAAMDYPLALGAHPSFADREGFGRRELAWTPEGICTLVREQIEALAEQAAALGVALSHVKPHGALYNMAARDPALADAILEGIAAVDRRLLVYGLEGGALCLRASDAGMQAVEEGFVDRGYAEDGRLLPRSHPQAVLDSEQAACAQALTLAAAGDGPCHPRRVDSLCLHGDHEGAAARAESVHRVLRAAGYVIAAPQRR